MWCKASNSSLSSIDLEIAQIRYLKALRELSRLVWTSLSIREGKQNAGSSRKSILERWWPNAFLLSQVSTKPFIATIYWGFDFRSRFHQNRFSNKPSEFARELPISEQAARRKCRKVIFRKNDPLWGSMLFCSKSKDFSSGRAKTPQTSL